MEETPLTAALILGLGDIRFLEPSYADLIDDTFTSVQLSIEAEQGRMLIDELSDPIAFALLYEGNWITSSYHLRKPTASLIEQFEETNGEIYQEDRSAWAAAVREYYSLKMMHSVTPAIEDVNPERILMVADLLDEVWGDVEGVTCLDACCGSGIGSHVLHSRGAEPLAYDNDPSLIALGLHAGRLYAKETMCIDGTRASLYIEPVPAGLGVMFGEINPFNQEIWEQITAEFIALTGRSIITVGKEDEANLICRWAQMLDCTVEIFENERDPIYDRWVCVIEK